MGQIRFALKVPVSNRVIAFVRETAPEHLPQLTVFWGSGKTETHFWEKGKGHDRNLWSPQVVWGMIDSIHMNPVRRGLCKSSEDWYWSSAREYLHPGTGPIPVDRHSLPEDPRGSG